MCGGVYEEDFDYVPEDDNENTGKEGSSVRVESRDRGVMGDIKFMTAGQVVDMMNDDD